MVFRDILGQDRPLAVLQSAIARDRLPHAYCFQGPEGVGKRSAAIALAKAVLCPNRVGEDACGVCPSCRKIDHRNHPDVVTLVPDGAFIKIAAVKELIASMAFRPLEGKRRVFLILEAERMNAPAANALLKTLEEPRAANILILVTARPYELPQTILSRCQRLLFTPLNAQTIARCLVERHGLDPAQAEKLAAPSGGSLSRALQLNKDDYLETRDAVLEYLAGARRPTPLATCFFLGWLGGEKKGIPEKLDILKTCFRDALIWGALKDRAALVYADRAEAAETLASRIAERDLLSNVRILEDAARALEQNANKTLTLEAALFRLAV